MSNEHGNLIKNPKQLIIMVFASFFVPLIIILLLMVFVNNGKRGDSSNSADQLIKPVGQLNFKDASVQGEPQTGGQVAKSSDLFSGHACAARHKSIPAIINDEELAICQLFAYGFLAPFTSSVAW